jgi:putative transposase
MEICVLQPQAGPQLRNFDDLAMNQFPPSRKQIRLPDNAYHHGRAFSITVATAHRHPWFHSHPSLAEMVSNLIIGYGDDPETNIFAWCIMPDHLHLLLQTPAIIPLIRKLKGAATPAARAIDPKRKLWQRSFYDHGLRKEENLLETARYIWNNPVRAKLVSKPADYSWSGSTVWPDWRNFSL